MTPVPAALQWGLMITLIGAGLISAVHIGEFSPLPVTLLLDVWIISFLLVALWKSELRAPAAIMLTSCYAVITILSAWGGGGNWQDFLQAYRWMLYLLVFAVAAGMRWTQRWMLVVLTWWLLGLATAKAAATVAILGGDERPGLFLENNFELALFSGLTAVVYEKAGRRRFLLVLLLGALTVLSGSRSGAIVYLLLVVYVISRADLRDAFLRFISAAGPVVAVLLSLAVFRERAAESEVIDRVRFLDLFHYETQGWGIDAWFFGTAPMTPLSAQTCAELDFYSELFSAAQDGTCYSVILHSFALRVLYDAGIIGALLVLLVPIAVMLRAGTPMILTLTLASIAVANSLSVSGLNNPYVALPILLAILLGTRTGSPPLKALSRPALSKPPLAQPVLPTPNRGGTR